MLLGRIDPPAWDIALVLRSLNRYPYEPLWLDTDKNVPLMIWLLPVDYFCLVKCISELHCLAYMLRNL